MRAFLHQSGQTLNLNNFVMDMSEWDYLGFATDINESGQIVGFGRLRGGFSDSEVFLLTPVPEHSVLTLMALAGIGLQFGRRRRSRISTQLRHGGD